MDTSEYSVWAIQERRDATEGKCGIGAITCSEALNSPFESFSSRGSSSRRRRRREKRGLGDDDDDDGSRSSSSSSSASNSPQVVSNHREGKLAGRPTTASHPKSTTAFRQLSDLLWQAQLNSVARRNERERKRVKLVNSGFAALRQKIPFIGKSKFDCHLSAKSSRASKLSKVETLRSAIKYIKNLQVLLNKCTPAMDAKRTSPVSGNEDTAPSSLSDVESGSHCFPQADFSAFSHYAYVKSNSNTSDNYSETQPSPTTQFTCTSQSLVSAENVVCHNNNICPVSSTNTVDCYQTFNCFSSSANHDYYSSW